MQRFTFALLLLLCVPAWAEWVRVADDEAATGYVEPATIHMQGNTVKMWSLLDYKAVQQREGGPPYLSMTTQFEYDCAEKRFRILAIVMYSANMGRGKVLSFQAIPEERWKPVQAGTRSEQLREIACKE